jgi:hypothetical protein
MNTDIHQKCFGGCGKERQLSSHELILYNLHGPLRWFCQPCADRIVAEDLLKPIIDALEKHPQMRAKLRKLILVQDGDE